MGQWGHTSGMAPKLLRMPGRSHTAQPACSHSGSHPCRNHPARPHLEVGCFEPEAGGHLGGVPARRGRAAEQVAQHALRIFVRDLLRGAGRVGRLIDMGKLAQCTAHTAGVLSVYRHCRRASSTFGSLLHLAAHLRQHAAVSLAGQQLVAHQHLPHIAVARIYRVAGGKLGG